MMNDSPDHDGDVLLAVVDPTYGSLPDLLNEIRHQAIEGQCVRIGQRAALHRIAQLLRDQDVSHPVLDLLEIESAVSYGSINGERQGCAIYYGIFSIGVREGWIEE